MLKIERETEKATDLGKQLPIVTHYEKDAGPYITGGIVVVGRTQKPEFIDTFLP